MAIPLKTKVRGWTGNALIRNGPPPETETLRTLPQPSALGADGRYLEQAFYRVQKA